MLQLCPQWDVFSVLSLAILRSGVSLNCELWSGLMDTAWGVDSCSSFLFLLCCGPTTGSAAVVLFLPVLSSPLPGPCNVVSSGLDSYS